MRSLSVAALGLLAAPADALLLTPRAVITARAAPAARISVFMADENEMEPEGGWNVDNLMEMMETADAEVADEAAPAKDGGDENEMEPDGGWNVDNLMEMMETAEAE